MTIERVGNPEINEDQEGAPIVYISGDIPDPATIIDIYLNRKLGNISPDYQLFPSLSVGQTIQTNEFVSISTTRKGFGHNLRDMINELSYEDGLSDNEKIRLRQEMRILKRITNYVTITRETLGYGKEKSPLGKLRKLKASTIFYDLMVGVSLRHHDDPKQIIEASSQLIDHLVDERIDPFTIKEKPDLEFAAIERIISNSKRLQEFLGSEIDSTHKDAGVWPMMEFELQEFLRDDKGHMEYGETRTEKEPFVLKRALGRLRMLEGQKVSLVIAGPPHSGKSTLTASLFLEMNSLLDTVRNNINYADLSVRCGNVDLDKSTPDVQRILHQETNERVKSRWTNERALDVALEFIDKDASIVIADAPGGKPDHVTDVVVAPADIALLLIAAEEGETWAKIRDQWRESLTNVGVKTAVLVNSRQAGGVNPSTNEEIVSAVTNFKWLEGSAPDNSDWIRYVGGRVVGLEMKPLENDPFVSTLAKLLVFDIFPQVVTDRKRRTKRYFESIYTDYLAHRVERVQQLNLG